MREETQRRLAAIVSADVVAYSRLMGADEAGTLAALRNHRAELIDGRIAEHGGRIVKTMGNGVPKDHVRGYAWSSIAAAQGDAQCKNFKEAVAKRMTPAQIVEGQKLSRELWEKYVVPFQKK
jgi:class 3 adenylate cyclase